MATNESELKQEVRDITDTTLDAEELDTAVDRAQRHIKVKKGLTGTVDWFDDPNAEEALFWTTCLFSKVATGELDSQAIRAGSIELESLTAHTRGKVTTWYRNAKTALAAMDNADGTAGGFGIAAPERDDRVYGEDDEATGGDIL